MKKIFSLLTLALVSVLMMAQTPANLYILGDINGIGWAPAGSAVMVKSGDTFTGKYTFSHQEGTAYFCFSTVQGDWEVVNANRYGTEAIINPTGTLVKGGDGTCATIANGTYIITVDWATQTVSAVAADPDPAPEAPEHLYILGNLKDLEWDTENKPELAKNGNIFTGTYTFVADETAYFCFTTTSSADWAVINANRYGTAAIINPTGTLIQGGENTCATIAPGTYLLTIDWSMMTITATSAATDLQGAKTYQLPVKFMHNGKVMMRHGNQLISVDGKAL